MPNFPLTLRCLLLAALVAVSSASCAYAQTALPAVVSVTVETGDQLGTIAQRYLVSPTLPHWQELAVLNKLKQPYTIYPGMTLLLPVRLLATQAVPAQWLAVTGEVFVKRSAEGPRPAVVGAAVLEGDVALVGANSSAVLRLADGSQMKLLAGSQVVLSEHRYYKGLKGESASKAFAGLLRLIQGAVETWATKADDRAAPLRIQTPTSVVGVRGTEFRVGMVGTGGVTRTEVVEGAVKAQLDERRAAEVTAGFGVILDPSRSALPVPKLLLPAPDVSSWRMAQDRTVLEFEPLPPAINGRAVAKYRVQLSKMLQRDHADAAQDAFAEMVFDRVFEPGAVVRIPGMNDGRWRVRVRAIDADGLEGLATTVTAMLRARPEPPLLQSPAAAAKMVQTEAVQLVWGAAPTAYAYVVELLDSKGVATQYGTKNPFLALQNLAPGHYQWRVATQSVITKIRVETFSGLALGGIETGPWSDRQTLTVVVLPEQAQTALGEEDARTLVIRWPDQKAARYEVQMSRVESFADAHDNSLVLYQTVRANVALKNPAYGTHFIRYRAIEADGFVGGWSGASKVEVGADWKMLLMYLGGGLKSWP